MYLTKEERIERFGKDNGIFLDDADVEMLSTCPKCLAQIKGMNVMGLCPICDYDLALETEW